MWLVVIAGVKRLTEVSAVPHGETCAFNAPNGSLPTFMMFRTPPTAASGDSDKMAFHSQHSFPYMPPPQSQNANAVQPPFGPGSFSVNGPTGSSSFNDLPLPSDQGAFVGHDFAPASTQNHDQPQSAGSFRAFSSQLVQLEHRLEGRFQEVRLRAESTDR
jgi:hypothetical protein